MAIADARPVTAEELEAKVVALQRQGNGLLGAGGRGGHRRCPEIFVVVFLLEMRINALE